MRRKQQKRLLEEIEKRARIVRLVEEVEKEGADPFSVNVVEIIEDLRKDYDSDDPELLRADSEAIEALSKLVKMQEDWLDSHLLAAISPERVRTRVEELDVKALAAALLLSQTPIAAVSSASTKQIAEAIKYWEALRPSRPEEPPRPRALQKPPLLEPERFEEMLEETRRLIEEALAGRGEMPLRELVSGELEEDVKRLYLVAHLITRGELGMRYDPEREEYILTRKPGVKEPVSIVLEVGEVERRESRRA